tara:strand:+ start:2314 stop:2499 length:186 start_codon:yes stop_codon:yes gene_type:complete
MSVIPDSSDCIDELSKQSSLKVIWWRQNRDLLVSNHLDQFLAGQEGIEPPTCGFGDRRSAN